ncbi:hypothetical protein L7F22_061163 [Adiantum nelumboides]|nr:hypothetical protein [Adiantum nelumboides]
MNWVASVKLQCYLHVSAAVMGIALRRPCGVSIDTVGYTALARDLFGFEITGQVPDELGSHVPSSREAQASWYRKLLMAWKNSQPPPSNAQEASQLVSKVLQGVLKVDVEGLLSFYGLSPSTSSSVAVPLSNVVVPAPAALYPQVAVTFAPWPQGVQYELHTLPVESGAAVDGDTVTVYVDTNNDAREAAAVPLPVQAAMSNWRVLRRQRDYKAVDACQAQISLAGYRVIDAINGSIEILARKYTVRLRGVKAPENSMPFGPEAKDMLQGLVNGQLLRLLVYDIDQYGRLVSDVYCEHGFVQEILLKNGGCWHYIAFDNREEFFEWEAEARSKQSGLWATYDPNKLREYEDPRNSSSR